MIRRASFPQRQRPKMYHLSTPPNLPLLFFFLVLSCWSLTTRAAVNEEELRSLLEFKKGIQEDPLSLVSISWNRSSDLDEYGCPKTWHGVVCDEESGSITALVLEELGLGGELKFSTLTGLKKFANLSLADNSLRGRLIPAIGGMSSLQHLDLSRNEFYGRINELWNLHYLNLSENKFSGGFPERVENLQQLRMLDLHKNGMWGDVGSLMAGLRNVEHVDLSDNMFFGGLGWVRMTSEAWLIL